MNFLSAVTAFLRKYFLLGFVLFAGIILIFCLKFNIFSGYSAKFSKRENNVAPIKEDKATPIKEVNQKSGEVIKVEVNKILEDANAWLQERIISNSREKGRLTIDFNKRGALRSEDHLITHIDRVNTCLESVDEYIKKMDGQIKGLLLSAKEEKFETVDWLKDEHEKYLKFIENAKTTKNNIKKQARELCIRFSDTATFDNVLKEHPFKSGADEFNP
ncbi:MAG: hypothetical protein NTY14_05970 [Candidatus Omnitrophica bacterium]|nr:hypothetical protein [Candidatus Omnitrophota bacterium]